MGLDDFITQIPSGLILMVCGSGVLLVVMWSLIIYRRMQKGGKAAVGPDTSPSASDSEITPPEASSAQSGEASGGGALAGIMKSIRDFFFYTEEEKAAREQETPAQPAGTSPARDPGAATAGLLTPEAPPDAVPIMHVYRDVVDGAMLIKIGDEVFRTMGDISAAGQNRRFMNALRELARLAKETAGETSTEAAPDYPRSLPHDAPPADDAEGRLAEAEPTVVIDSGPEPVDAPVSVSEPIEAPPDDMLQPLPEPDLSSIVQEQEENDAEPVPDVSPADQSATSPPRRLTYVPPAETEPIGSFFDNVKRAVKNRGKVPESQEADTPILSIADQIEEVLQNKLRHSQEHQGRQIHIHPAVDGGVQIEVDGVFFPTVAEIDDEAVRSFVQDAIREWEERG